MQYKALSLLALSASVIAAPEKREAAATSADVASIYEVLATALPSSLVAEALTNSAAVYSEVQSEFAHSETPTWFTALPSDIQTYLVPVVTNSAALSSAVASVSGVITSTPAANTSVLSRNGTSATLAASSIIASNSANDTLVSQTLSSTSTGSSSTKSGSSSTKSGSSSASDAGSSGSSSTSTGGASLPTSFYGMSLAGAIGLAGVLAL